MIRKNTKIIAILSLVSLLVAATVFGVFFMIVSDQKEEHLSRAAERAEAQAHKESLQNLMRVLDDTKVERESLFTRFLKEEEVIDFLALIEMLGKERGVTLTTSSLDTATINTYFESLTIKLELGGSYRQVLSLLSLFEKLPYQVAIYDVQMNKSDDKTWIASIVLSVTKFTKNEL